MMSYQLYCQFCLAPETRPGSDQTPDPGYTCDRCAYAYEAGRIDEANAQAGKRAAERIGNDDTVSPRAEATDAGVQDAALLEAGGEALPPVVHEALEGVRDRSRDAGDALERLAAQIVERRDGKAAATIADLRDRLRVLEPMVCEGCGCAARANPSDVDDSRLCVDCDVEHWPGRLTEDESVEAACLSVGLRALCGRRLTEGCE